MELPERIFTLLKNQKKTAKELATFLDVSQAAVNGWKNGSYPSSKYIIKISEFLDVSVEWLLTGEGEKTATMNVVEDIWKSKSYQREAVNEYYPNLSEDQALLLNNFEKLSLTNKKEIQTLIKYKLDVQQHEEHAGRDITGTA